MFFHLRCRLAIVLFSTESKHWQHCLLAPLRWYANFTYAHDLIPCLDVPTGSECMALAVPGGKSTGHNSTCTVHSDLKHAEIAYRNNKIDSFA
jgi:hypothetical protein